MSEKLEAMLQAVIDAETDTAYHYASESLTEAAPEILALIKARTPAPEGEACPHDAYETDAAGQPVRCVDCGMAIASAASLVVPVGVSREEIARAVHRGRFPEDRKPTPFEAEDASGTTYCFRIADAIIAALRPTDTGANHD